MTDAAPRQYFSAPRQALAHRNFALFTIGNMVSLLGTWTQRVSVGWLTWELTHSGTWLGAVAMAEFMPVIILAPMMGALADRYDRRRISVIGQCLATLQAAFLAVLTFSGHITPALILAAQLFAGLVQPLIQTARLVLVPTLVPRPLLGTAIAITSLIFNIARIIGPMLAGIFITTVGAAASFAVNAVSYVGVIAALMAMRLPTYEPVSRESLTAWGALWRDVIEGWRYTFTHPTIKWMMTLVAISSTLTWPLGDLMAGIADVAFGMDAKGLAMLTTAQGIGAICGGLFLARRGETRGSFRLGIIAMSAAGLFVAAFAVIKVFWIALPILACSSMFGVMLGVSSQTVTQMGSAENMRARTMSVWYIITRVGPATGALGLGTLTSHFGFTLPLFIAGLTSSGAAAFFLWNRRARVTSAPPPPP